MKVFLTAFAGSGNVAASARECGIPIATLYSRRMKDAQFRAAWAAAQDQAIAALRAELVGRGLALLRAATPEEASHHALAGMDAKFLLSLVEAHERNAGKAPGDIHPQRSDVSEATKRLQALLVRMRLERQRAEAKQRQEPGA